MEIGSGTTELMKHVVATTDPFGGGKKFLRSDSCRRFARHHKSKHKEIVCLNSNACRLSCQEMCWE